jgi:hypothetical protein
VFGSRNIECYPWHISTKYYEADVHFLLLPERDLVSESFSKAIEAAVFHVDIDADSFTSLQTWIPFVNEFEPEIRILCCDNAPENGPVTRIQIQTWCIDNGFEFVELNPTAEEVDDEVEDDFHESNSYLRIRQALQAHPWPNLTLKGMSRKTRVVMHLMSGNVSNPLIHRLPAIRSFGKVPGHPVPCRCRDSSKRSDSCWF